MINPKKNIDYIIDEAEYWTQFYDSTHGGFFSFVDANGNVTEENIKALCPQSRLGYSYARAFMVTGDEKYLKYSHYALKFLYQHGWDEQNDGWFFTTDREGVVTDGQGSWDKYNTTLKQAFMQNYALLGPTAISEATGGNLDWEKFLNDENEIADLTDWDWVMKGYNSLMTNMWDSRSEYIGHYYEADFDWSNPRDKGFTPTGDAMTTNAVILSLLTNDADIKSRLLTIADNISDYLVASIDDPRVKLGFAEIYNTEWEINEKKHRHLLGHVYKASWCLGRAYLIEPKEKYREAANRLLNNMWDDGGYDKENGGAYKKYDWETGEIRDENKNHWTLEQVVLSGLINYYISDDENSRDIYLRMADESIDFYMNNLRDLTNGGSFSETNKEGTEITDGNKGNVYGANYHGIELAYFTYLYSNLFLHDSTISLYYYFSPSDEEQTISLYPLAFSDEDLKIRRVQLNDLEFSNFAKDERTLTLAPGEGGKFLVTFGVGIDSTTVSVNENQIVENFELHNNYPNPFNPTTVIKYTIPNVVSNFSSSVLLKVYDALGKEVITLVNREQPSGNYKVTFDATNYPSGVYYYQLTYGNFTDTKKMILVK